MRLKIIFVLVLHNLTHFAIASNQHLHFNPAFLSGDIDNTADLSWISNNNTIPPGNYNINVYINKSYAFSENVIFKTKKSSKDSIVSPCFTSKQLHSLNLDLNEKHKLEMKGKCFFLSYYFPDTGFDFNQDTLTLNLNVPQKYMINLPRGYVNPSSWDYGIDSAWLNYVINGSNNEYKGDYTTRDQQLYINLNSAVNIGKWRFRDFSTWTRDDNRVKHVQSWIQRDLQSIRSQIYLGETYTSSQLFDSLGVKGFLLRTDDNMLPASLIGYAPVVRGIARSHATVTIRQNGNIIYQTSVSPGEFALNDLYPTSSGGDLLVTIKESNGSIRTFTVPFASVPNLVREGQIKYAISAGKYHGNDYQTSPYFNQLEMFYGFRFGISIYGGWQISDDYKSGIMGVGQNLGSLGAYSFDITHARSTLQDERTYIGDSVRLRYSKSLNDVGTQFNFYSLRYSTKGFYTLSDTTYKTLSGGIQTNTIDDKGVSSSSYNTIFDLRKPRKSKNQILLSQSLYKLGAISFSWDKQTYWNTSNTTESSQIAWNSTYNNVFFSLSYQHTSSLFDDTKNNIISFSCSVPFGDKKYSTRSRFSIVSSNSSGTIDSAGVSGYTPGIDNLYYSVNQRYSAKQNYGSDISLQYEGSRGNYNLGYSHSKKSESISYGTSGGIVLHGDGITLSQPLGNTNILIKAQGAKDVSVLYHKGVKTDSKGYAVVPFATPYRVNQVSLDITSADDSVEIIDAIVNKTPTEGALVRANFAVNSGYKAMFIIKNNQIAIPFGALVTIPNSTSSGIVGDGGSVYLSGLQEKGDLLIRWGKSQKQSCKASFKLDIKNHNKRTGLFYQEVICH
ncbi:fimbria/pilus outer membrane usher protein [Klebsiella aerogenes]